MWGDPLAPRGGGWQGAARLNDEPSPLTAPHTSSAQVIGKELRGYMTAMERATPLPRVGGGGVDPALFTRRDCE